MDCGYVVCHEFVLCGSVVQDLSHCSMALWSMICPLWLCGLGSVLCTFMVQDLFIMAPWLSGLGSVLSGSVV